jgi:predicted metal-dependent hydrolase
VLEDAWKTAPPGERELWRGLAQVAVGLTHARRGNGKGAVALLRRGGSAVGGYREEAPHGIDAAGVSERASRLADRIEREGLDQIPAAELALRLSRTA